MKVYVIIGAYKGLIEGIKVALSLDEAYEKRGNYDEDLGIERDQDGRFDSENADVQMFEVSIDQAHVVSNVQQI